MSLVRCDQCGEVADLERIRTCRGCDQPLPEAPPARPPRQVPPAQRETGSDLSASKAILLSLLIGGGILLALLLQKEAISLAAAVVLSGFLAVLWKLMTRQKRRRDPAPAEFSDDPVRLTSTRPGSGSNSPPDDSWKTFCLCVWVAIAIVSAVLIAAFVIFYISCLA